MTIELNDDSYIVGLWFSSDPVSNNDWLACVVRDPENPKGFKGWSRFRYTKDDNVFDSKDEKSWSTFRARDESTEDEMIESMQHIQDEIAAGYPEKDSIIVKGSLAKLMKLAKEKPWMNMMAVH